MSTNYRCTRDKCRKRLTLSSRAKTISSCPACGSHLAHDPSIKARTKRQTCTCDSLPFPHRRGTLGCSYGPRMDEDDYRAMIRHIQRAVKW